MGDRANVAIQANSYGPKPHKLRVYLYTHWRGSELPGLVQEALRRKQRWNDAPYLARIVFAEMVQPERLMDETGFGVSAQVRDNEHPVLVLDTDTQTVTLEADGACAPCNPVAFTFDAFIMLKGVTWKTLGA